MSETPMHVPGMPQRPQHSSAHLRAVAQRRWIMQGGLDSAPSFATLIIRSIRRLVRLGR